MCIVAFRLIVSSVSTDSRSNPSMGPMNIIIFLGGIGFNIINGSLIGGWLGGYGSTSNVPTWRIATGSIIFFAGLLSNMYHEGILRDIRRDSPTERSSRRGGTTVMSNGRLYKIPEGGLFRWIWTPHVCPTPFLAPDSRIPENRISGN